MIQKRKNVLLVRNAEFKDFGGGERFPVLLAEILNKYGYASYVASRSPLVLNFASNKSIKTIKGWWWKRQNWSGLRVTLTPFYFLWQLILFFWYIYIVVKNKVSILHLQGKDDFIAGTIAGKLLRKKVIWTDHADLKHLFNNLYVWYKNPIGKAVYLCGLMADSIVIVSQNEYQLIFNKIKSNNRLKNKIELIYNGVSDSKYKYHKKSNKLTTFGLATRLVVDKGFSEAIEAFNQLSAKYEDVLMKIIGDGPDSKMFKKQAKNNKKIIFTGHIDDPYSEILNLDIFMHPTYHESFSMSIVEASMLALPIIATRVGGNPEIIIDHKTGLLVDVKDVKSLYSAMEELYLDKKLRSKLAKEARKQYLEKFNFDDIVKNQYIPLYEK